MQSFVGYMYNISQLNVVHTNIIFALFDIALKSSFWSYFHGLHDGIHKCKVGFFYSQTHQFLTADILKVLQRQTILK